jgi:hypothetical protein
MAEVWKDKRYRQSEAEGVKTLEEPMEATLADQGGQARMTWSITGSREAGVKLLTGTIEFAGFGVQVFVEDPLLNFDKTREFAQDLWQIANRQTGELSAAFEPNLRIKIRSPSKLAARQEVNLEFEMGTDAKVNITMQIDGTMTLAFVEALDRALEAVEELG